MIFINNQLNIYQLIELYTNFACSFRKPSRSIVEYVQRCAESCVAYIDIGYLTINSTKDDVYPRNDTIRKVIGT